jgi:hypothetical protein
MQVEFKAGTSEKEEKDKLEKRAKVHERKDQSCKNEIVGATSLIGLALCLDCWVRSDTVNLHDSPSCLAWTKQQGRAGSQALVTNAWRLHQ